MLKTKLFSLFFLVCFLASFVFLVVPVHAASDVSIASHWVGSFQEYEVTAVHPSANADHSGAGQGFKPSVDGYYLTAIRVSMKKTGSPTGALVARIVELDANSTTGQCTENVLGTSTNYIISSDLTGLYANYTFTFNQTLQLQNDIYYGFTVTGYNASYTAANKAVIEADRYSASNNYADGVAAYYSSSSWHKELLFSLYFEIFANVDAYEEPEPPPPDTIWDNADITQLATYAVALGIILLPLGVLMALRVSMNPFIILIAIGLGAGLGWVLMPTVVPLWLVFVVVIGLIGLAYYTMRR